jgi:hypothetical protein
MGAKPNSGWLSEPRAPLWSHLGGVGFLRMLDKFSWSIARTDSYARAWVYGPELVPVRYRHVGGALNGKKQMFSMDEC